MSPLHAAQLKAKPAGSISRSNLQASFHFFLKCMKQLKKLSNVTPDLADKPLPSGPGIDGVEIEAIELFINFLKLIGLPKSQERSTGCCLSQRGR